jgi:hypothetical protein
MTKPERTQMLSRFADADRWLAKVYSYRSDKHRAALWNILITTSEKRFRNILLVTRDLDESANRYWDQQGKN